MEKTQLNYEEYYDKVLGCFMGKCICGTMGAPYEGMKQILHLEYNSSMVHRSVPNDDLDIQLVWLEVLEKYGEYFTSIDLANAFYYGYPHSPGEYAYFKKNYERKIYPPASGSFNNSFYENGMGSPIRSEIWACVNPASVNQAMRMAGMDGCIDHKHDSIVAEQYLAALQSMAFMEEDIYRLLQMSRRYLFDSDKLLRVYDDVLRYYQNGFDIFQMRELILREYGHPDCTNLYQNMGIIWSALLAGEGDIIRTVMLAVNCGFDTDCTAATVGAILGLILGGERLKRIFDVDEVYYTAEALVNRPDCKISTLAKDIAEIGCYFSNKGLLDINIILTGRPKLVPIIRNFTYGIQYHGEPVLKQENKVSLFLKNNAGHRICCHIKSQEKEGFEIFIPAKIWIEKDASTEVPVEIRTSPERNISEKATEFFTLSITEKSMSTEIVFGLCRGILYQVYGPYWENVVEIPQLSGDESYYDYLGNADEIRAYHLNMKCDFTKEYLPEKNLRDPDWNNKSYKKVVLTKDCFKISDLFGFEGPCVVYMVRKIFCAQNQKCMIYVGKSDKIKLWLNEELLLFDESYEYCTCENRHIVPVSLKQGNNRLVIKLARSAHEAYYSILFLEEGEIMNFPKQLLL